MKELISIKGLNNKIDKLFEDELEDVKIIKDIKDVITRYENAKDYKLKSRLASKLRSLSTQLRDFQRNSFALTRLLCRLSVPQLRPLSKHRIPMSG